MEFFDLIERRRSIRVFKQKLVEEEKIRKILETANKAPSAGNLQAYEIVVVQDKEIKKKLYEAALQQDSILLASVVFIFFANPLRSSWKYGKRGEELYSLQDATIAATYAHLAATDLGLGSVWVGAFDDEKVKKALKAPKEVKPVVILPVGYPAEQPEKTKRRVLKDLVKWENF